MSTITLAEHFNSSTIELIEHAHVCITDLWFLDSSDIQRETLRGVRRLEEFLSKLAERVYNLEEKFEGDKDKVPVVTSCHVHSSMHAYLLTYVHHPTPLTTPMCLSYTVNII